MTTMPMWQWKNRSAARMLSRSKKLRTELLIAVAELDVFTAALRAELDHDESGGPDDTAGTDRPDR